ncbi:MAG TPA: hypothetical protein VGV59_14860 [Pyrinomonadaceae bacterium]|nr:hypothetical protein [Pyrinomonadaceae bacterium]
MTSGKIMQSGLLALALLSGVLAASLLFARTEQAKSPSPPLPTLPQSSPALHAPTETVQSGTADDDGALDYRVWRVFPEDRRGFTLVVVSVNPKHFNRADMTALAARLKREFAEKAKLKVGLVDDDDTARLFVEGRVNYPTYERAERGRYYLDRNACREHIQFSEQRGRPRKTIRLDCPRPPRR